MTNKTGSWEYNKNTKYFKIGAKIVSGNGVILPSSRSVRVSPKTWQAKNFMLSLFSQAI